jgi:L-asparaginase II
MVDTVCFPLVSVFRGDIIESRHFGIISIVDPYGVEHYRAGDSGRLVYIRSAAKPFQLVPLVEKGLDKRYGFTDAELALMCASHSGQGFHVKTVVEILEKIGLSEDFLLCGTHYPYDPEMTDRIRRGELPLTPIYNCCSAKHAGMLARAKAGGYDLSDYIKPEHPVQRENIRVLAEIVGISPDEIRFAVDGCGVPTFALPLKLAALAYARLADPSPLPDFRAEALSRIFRAMEEYPEMVGGTHGRLDTELMKTAHPKLVAKLGAEAFYGIGLIPGALSGEKRGLGIAFKIEDGNYKRAVPPVAVELLYQLGVLSEIDVEKLSAFHHPPVRNNRGETVGEVRSSFDISKLKLS